MRNIEDLKRLAAKLSAPVDAIEDISILAKPVQVGRLMLPNALAVHPMEGCDGDAQGRPGPLTFRRYERFAAGGAGLIWAEAIAVVPEGRANPRQLWLSADSMDHFTALLQRAHQAARSCNSRDHRPVIVAQLTHSGRYSKPYGAAAPLIGQRDPYRDPLKPQVRPDTNVPSALPADYPAVTDEYLDRLQDAYVAAARTAFKAGFDAVDIKACHGYLINELLACRQRQGRYGGSFENRTRFLLEVIDRIHGELGNDKPVFVRLGIYDAIPFPYGWGVSEDDYALPDLSEPKKLIELLCERGVKMINITIANPYYNPHFGRPFNEPVAGGYASPEHPLIGVSRLIRLTGEIQHSFKDLAVVGTGYSWLRTLMPHVAAATKAAGNAALIGAGRLAFAYPDFARDIVHKGRLAPEKVCVACSACTQIMRDGGKAGCVVRDNAVYGPIFRKGRMSNRENLARLASACTQCQEPTCQLACPAGIEIPRFIRLFLDGDDKGAYAVIRKSNIFPEVCAWLCPVEQQCQGACLQHFIGDGALPIADIQRYLAEQANRKGWSRLQVPQESTGRKIAIVGAGPAGLTAAAVLLEQGHQVTVFDKATELGGIVRSMIPADRQETALNNEIEAVFKDVRPDRLTLRLATALSPDFDLNAIMAGNFDAAFIGIGLPKSVQAGHGQADGVYSAGEFLMAAKCGKPIDVCGKRVAVVGGGNTAMDAAVTAARSGAQDVYVIYRRGFHEMPAWDAERNRALAAGVNFLILTAVQGLHCENGRLRGLKLCPTTLGEPDASGRRRPQAVASSTYELVMDVMIEAIGQTADNNLARILPGVTVADGLIRTQPNSFATSRPGIYAGGDIVRGPSTVAAAVADGMKAAAEIDAFLKQKRG
ncbi:MAG TPA: FAD-dependent oxidoreductase [Anaerohalosphaeraceae bacterium]|nr:FAD-dependent oxidoreductase [Anaerohalosphaeraceae bacterium]HRT49062.1 FAD-dependent oxidoreductase [Anaerohalosphaeraceae bacterium]HRT85685.1 FAD-dependent oxidoreductase [Anaerohalosphaeraceae bacterium]